MRIKVTPLMEAVSVPIDTATPCGLLLCELLSNAFRHAFPGDASGEVRVSIGRTAGGRISLEVSDDGIGLPERFDASKTETLGYQLVHGMVDQLKGELSFGSGQGLSCRVSFSDTLIADRV
jgi:two-component sensor histidine kinase